MRNDGVIGKIGQQEWLKPEEGSLQKLVHKAFQFTGGRHVKSFLHGTWLPDARQPVPLQGSRKPIPYEELELERGRETFDIQHEFTRKGIEKFGADYRATLPRPA